MAQDNPSKIVTNVSNPFIAGRDSSEKADEWLSKQAVFVSNPFIAGRDSSVGAQLFSQVSGLTFQTPS